MLHREKERHTKSLYSYRKKKATVAVMEKTVARDPLTTARDDVSERSECRRAIIGQTCGRDDSFETTEAGKNRRVLSYL